MSDTPRHPHGDSPRGGSSAAEVFDPAWTLFHGGGLLVIDKPSGIAVEAGTGHDQGLVQLVDEWARLNPRAIELKAGRTPFPVDHLDVEASGVLVLALKRPIARAVQEAFAARTVERRFVTLIAGPLDEAGTFRTKIRGRVRGRYELRDGEVKYRRVCGDERLSLVEVTPDATGRHLVRAVLAGAGKPVAGDTRYGKPRPSAQFLDRFALPHFLLHSAEIVLPPTVLGGARKIVAPLPAAFDRVAAAKGWADDPAYQKLAESLEKAD